MPLSEHEQRILDEIERRLAEEDPKFARTTTKTTPRGVAVRRIKRAMVAFAAGLATLMAGLVAGGDLLLPFGLGAFGVMLASVTVIARSARGLEGGVLSGDQGSGTWFDRLEARWRKRLERPNDER